ncbi:hypothetical protein EUTSA_v10000332mg [Eutrema salsugineum]|uniref:Cyclin-dependent kinase inhibitor n=1 Tax=Eutrema salsugineum TaxID=72664 RepID=V4LUW2_EUTSA|nr:cyclin-dependent kinase inhibitor 1 [Eutrema salsugineum]ESQ46282.1 hypothetical protein EUTSA_v10000332mg [Eutrema salsugineum]
MVRKCRKAKGMVEAGIGASSTYMQLRSRRIVYVSRSENSSSVVVADDNKGVSSSNLSSCCASNEYKSNGFMDLEEERDGDTETSTFRRNTKRKLFENLREKSMESSPEIAADFVSAVKESSDCCCSGRRSSPATTTMTATEEKVILTTEQPTEAEIEEFFVEAEKQLHDKFKKKYNFDFEKEKPLEGRYEWVKLAE